MTARWVEAMTRGLNEKSVRSARGSRPHASPVASFQLPANNHLAFRINAVNLKDRLRDIETDRRDRLHSWLLRIVGALTAPTSMVFTCRVEEPSTASKAEPCTAAIEY